MFKSKSGKGFSNANMARVQDARDQQGKHQAAAPPDPNHRTSQQGHVHAQPDQRQSLGAPTPDVCPHCGGDLRGSGDYEGAGMTADDSTSQGRVARGGL